MPSYLPTLLPLLLSTTLPLTTATLTPNNTTNTTTAAASSSSLPLSALPSTFPNTTTHSSFPLTLQTYVDPDCTYLNATNNLLLDAALPLTYNVPQPSSPFQGFILARNLTAAETLTVYATSNASAEACGVAVGNVTAGDFGGAGAAGWCVASWGGTCFELTRG